MVKWFDIKIKSKDKFHDWLLETVGLEVYLQYQLWDTASMLHYITRISTSDIYEEFLKETSKLEIVDFKKGKQ